jgi:murein DD-endopeptidase MepM/ murein hydrolase activator NlpD
VIGAKRKIVAGERLGPWSKVASMLTLVVFGLSLAVVFPSRRIIQPPPAQIPELWATPEPGDQLKRGNPLSRVLAARGFDTAQIIEITRLLRPYRDPRALRPGAVMRFASAPGEDTPSRIGFELNPDSILHFVRSDSTWTARLELVPFVMDTVRISGVIETSLWSAHLGGDLDRFGTKEFEDLVYAMADVLAWKVDFTRDLRKGDAFRIALERKVRPDGSIRSRHFLVIELRNRDRVIRAFPITHPDGRFAYFDEEGRSLHGAFLRYPVPYRITSHFTNRRYHPVLKRYRRHEGIDYGAPTGTPVEATASGVVTRAGFMGGYGRIVELRHAREIRTRYAHLSAIAASLRPGVRVNQGDIIGRVGSSGLATGPHLHYEFILNGRHRDPLTVDLPAKPSLDQSHIAAFRQNRDQAMALIVGVPIPYDLRVALHKPLQP